MLLKNTALLVSLFALVGLTACSDDDAVSTLTIRGTTDVSASARAGSGEPTTVKFNLYAVYVSENADCTDAQLVQDYGATPVQFDMLQNPVLFAGSPPAGEYHCVILKMQDVIKFKAGADAVAANPLCTDTDTEHDHDIYRTPENTWVTPTGTTVSATDIPGVDTIYTFLTTDDTAAIGGDLVVDANQIIDLAQPLTVPGTGTFVVSVTDSIDDSGGACRLEDIGFSFE